MEFHLAGKGLAITGGLTIGSDARDGQHAVKAPSGSSRPKFHDSTSPITLTIRSIGSGIRGILNHEGADRSSGSFIACVILGSKRKGVTRRRTFALANHRIQGRIDVRTCLVHFVQDGLLFTSRIRAHIVNVAHPHRGPLTIADLLKVFGGDGIGNVAHRRTQGSLDRRGIALGPVNLSNLQVISDVAKELEIFPHVIGQFNLEPAFPSMSAKRTSDQQIRRILVLVRKPPFVQECRGGILQTGSSFCDAIFLPSRRNRVGSKCRYFVRCLDKTRGRRHVGRVAASVQGRLQTVIVLRSLFRFDIDHRSFRYEYRSSSRGEVI